MEPLTFELAIDADGQASVVPRGGVLVSFVPPAEHDRPVVAMACDPRKDPGKPIGELAAAVVRFVRAALDDTVGEVLWASIDNYGRFFEVVPNATGVSLERFQGGLSVESFFKAAGASGEAAIELLSALLEAPRATETTPTEAEFLDAVEAHSHLPAPGAIFQKVDAASQDGDARSVAAAVQPDPVLSSSLINSANAARFANAGKTGSVPQAVVRLGTGFVRRIVFVAEMMARYQKGACREFDYRSYWMNAIANAAAMRGLMEEFEIPPRYADDAFSAGLVAGIGWLVIAETYPDLMTKYLERCRDADPITKTRAYREIFPCPITLVSERFLERFSFPDTIRQAITGRMAEHRTWFDALAKATRVANSLSPFICNTVPTTIPVPEPCRTEWEQWRTIMQ